MCSDHSDRKAREDRRNERPRPRALSPVQQAHEAADRELSRQQDLAARTGRGSLILQDPRDLAARVGGMAQMAHVEERPGVGTWSMILAVALAGWCAAALAEELDVASGEAA